LAHYVSEELARRKKAGKYNGKFASVTHFHGHQGRAAHPSNFDCSLGSTLGYSAACLIEGGFTGLCATVKELTNDPQ